MCIGFLGVALALRVAFASRYRVSSDEPQHLHVVWAWTQHLLPYRDVFDNHMPLFHALYAPVLRALGERPDILVAMRLAMVPLWAGSLVALYALGRTLFDARTARWVSCSRRSIPRPFSPRSSSVPTTSGRSSGSRRWPCSSPGT